MAFSAHNEMGQNERIETVCSTASRPRPCDSGLKNADGKPVGEEITKTLAKMQIMDEPTVNGEDATNPSAQPSQHIALHLLSKVLDDETIFNLEEGSNPPLEPFLPLTVDPTLRSSDVSSSWISTSSHASPDCAPDSDQQSSSFRNEHIWQNSDVNHNNSGHTPITSPSPVPAPHGWVMQSPISSPVAYIGRSENSTPFMNGYDNLPSPQMSSSVESIGNSGYFGTQYCSPSLPDEWVHLSDSEITRRGDIMDHPGSFDYSRISPVHAPVGLVCLSGSWPRNDLLEKDYNSSTINEKEMPRPKNGFTNAWKGCETAGRPIPFQRSLSCKSDDDSWIGRGKESLMGSSYPKHNPSNELHLRIDQCYEQLRYLEKERRKAEIDISKFWPTRRVSSGGGNVSSGRLHHSSSRVDKLLVDVQKEHGKVEALVGRIERIRHSPLNINISESVDDMMACIRRLQSFRKDEIAGRSKHGARATDGRVTDIISLISAVRDLAMKTRGCRTAVWCASQLVLSEMTKTGMATPRSRSSSNSESGVELPPSPVGGGVS